MEKDSTLTTESYINAYYIVSSARVNFNQNPVTALSVKMAMTTETYMDRRLSVPLCMDNSHHNTNKQEISESYGRDTQ
jgi:hypothetical protein